MLAGKFVAPEKVELIEVPEPTLPARAEPGEEQILFEIDRACLCGSDLLYFEGTYPEFPIKVGHSLHEMTGVVKETNGKRFKAGDRVLCVPVNQVGLFERFCVTERRAIPLDPRPPEDEALLAQPLGTVICAMKKVPSVLDQDVVVMGQGPMGQLFNATLRNLGARRIIGVDLLASRLAKSPEMGATHTIDASQENAAEIVREITGGNMADLVIEVVGHREQTLNQCVELSRRLGSILFFGVPRKIVNDLNWYDLFRKNITVYTSVEPDFDRDFPLAMQWVAEKRINVAPLITHRFPLAQIQEAFDTFRQRTDGALKVFLDFPAQGN